MITHRNESRGAAYFIIGDNMTVYKDMRKELLKANNMPIIDSIDEFAEELLISHDLLRRISMYSYAYYKEFYIRKKGKNAGLRLIVAPKYTLKAIQAWILRNILEQIQLHDSAMAYRRGAGYGIKSNALVHRDSEYIMKVDFSDFFSSIKRNKVFYLFNDLGYSMDISNLFANICTYRGYLPQGAVTSPYISNLLLRDFDEALTQYCLNREISYSRYSDDIVLSCNRRSPLEEAETFVRGLSRDYSFTRINPSKSFKIYGNDSAKLVTGLLINNDDLRVPRKYRRRLRSQIFYDIVKGEGSLSQETRGKLAYVKDMDPKSYGILEAYIESLYSLAKEDI